MGILRKIWNGHKKPLVLLTALSAGCAVVEAHFTTLPKSEQQQVKTTTAQIQSLMPKITGRDNVSKTYDKFNLVLTMAHKRHVDDIPADLLTNIKNKLNEYEKQEGFKKSIKDGDLTNQELAIFAMLQTLDKHSSYLSKREYALFTEDTSGKFGGLGIRIKYDEGYIRVMSIFNNTPAHRAKLQKDDLITHADGKHLRDYSPTETLTMLRGRAGTSVTITVKRGDTTFNKKITRGIINIPTQEHRLLEHNIGYLKLNVFNSRARASMLEALRDLEKQNNGELSGLVLDLRHNPGGLLTQAIDVSGMFLRDVPVVSIKTPNDQTVHDANHATDFDKPVVILINGGSASASEIVSGALRDYNRATLVGDKSYGKGTVQNVVPLRDLSAIKLTVARYYLPQGETVGEGIVPDIEIKDDPETPADEQLDKALAHLKNQIGQKNKP